MIKKRLYRKNTAFFCYVIAGLTRNPLILETSLQEIPRQARDDRFLTYPHFNYNNCTVITMSFIVIVAANFSPGGKSVLPVILTVTD